jgi:hypothetical protein
LTLGGALKTGFQRASKEIIVYTDIDMPFDLNRIKDLLVLTETFDIIKGCRAGGRESFVRTVYSAVYNWLIQFLFNVRFKDINFSLKIFKKKLLADLNLRSEGSFIDAEFMVKSKKLGCTIKEVEIEYTPRRYGISRLSSPGVILRIIYEMIQLFPEVMTYSKKKIVYQKAKRLYRHSPLRVKAYNWFRLATCPFLRVADFIVPSGRLVELGCGTGIFLNLVRVIEADTQRALVGVDKESWKIDAARASSKGEGGPLFEIGDLLCGGYVHDGINCAVMIDVLCYFSQKKKKEILQKCFDGLNDGGVLLVKDINKGAGIAYWLTLLQEVVAIKCLRLARCEGFYFGSKQEYTGLLESSGFQVDSFDLSKGYPYPHILYVAKKKNGKNVAYAFNKDKNA